MLPFSINKILYISYAYISLFALASCEQKDDKSYVDKDGITTKKLFYPEGGIKSSQNFRNDSVPHGYYKMYYENGKLAREIMYQNGIKNGIDKAYYPNGQVKYIGWNKNNLADSVTVWYSESGNIKGRYSWRNGKAFGEQFEFFSMGQIQFYFFGNLNGETIYSREYSKSGNVIAEKGKMTYSIYNKSRVGQGDTFEVLVYLATPPNTNYSFISIDPETGERSKEKINEFYSYKQIYYSRSFTTPGKYKWLGIYSVKDIVTNRINKDTVNVEVEVIAKP